jgi:HK97 family phage major capsid protein
MISVINQSLEERFKVISELEAIDSTPGDLSRKQESRKATLLAKLAALRDGTAVEELRRWEQDRLLREAGLPRAPERGRLGRLDEDIEAEWRNFAQGGEVRKTHVPPDSEVRAYSGQLAGQQSILTTQGGKGGFFVAPGMSPRLYSAMKAYDAIFDDQFCNVVETDTGAVTPFPIWSDVGNAAVQVGETVQGVEVQVAPIGSTQLNAFAFRSQIVAVSIELLQDSNWPIGAVLEKIFAKRIARGVGKAMISGTGVSSPTGLITGAIAAGAKVVVASGSSTNTGGAETGANSIGSVDLGKLYAALDPAYRDQTAAFYMNDGTLQYIRQLTDKQGRPLIELGRDGLTGTTGTVAYLLGKRVAICPSMPSMASAANSVVFANPDYIVQRRVPSATFVRRFAEAVNLVEAGLCGFEMWSRFDSNLVSGDSNFAPAAVLQQHS